MEELRDCNHHLVCMGDPISGFVESIYKGHKTSTILSPGEIFTIERQGVVTKIKRTETGDFSIDSHIIAA
jgi:hypothetical protein